MNWIKVEMDMSIEREWDKGVHEDKVGIGQA